MEQTKQRIVVKVGTSTLTHPSGALDLRSMEHLVRALADLQGMGHEVILVTSGAIAVGTAHGAYKLPPKLDFDRIETIARTIPTPLVLHGGSGVPDEQIRMAVEAGIRKVNFATDLCYAFLDQVMVTERTTVALDVFMREPIHAVRDYCIGKIKLLGADKIL